MIVAEHRSAAAEPLRTPPGTGDRGHLPAPTERQSHYFQARPADQFDAIIHIDRTRALEPIEVTSLWVEGETPETYPTGL